MRKKKLGFEITNSGHIQFTHNHDIHVLPDIFSAAQTKKNIDDLSVKKKKNK